jgi:hypothetical protein
MNSMSRSSSSRSIVRSLVIAASLGCASAYSASARAAPAFTLERATLGGGVRFGTEDLNFGLGVRGGYTLNQGIYIGGLFDYWFGESDESNALGVAGASSSFSAWDLMAVVGYDAGVTRSIVIRPYGGFGIIHGDFEYCASVVFVGETCQDDSDSDGAGVIGGEALFDLGGFHIGPELRILIYDDAAFIFGGNIGGTF